MRCIEALHVTLDVIYTVYTRCFIIFCLALGPFKLSEQPKLIMIPHKFTHV